MSLKFKPTRYELAKLNRLLSIAQRSSKLLQQKYQILNQEYQKVRDELKRFGIDINRELLRVYNLINKIENEIGEEKVRRAAISTVKLNEVVMKWANVKGILVPQLFYSDYFPEIEDRGYYLLETNADLDEAAEEMHKVVVELVRYADLVNRQKILLRELKKVEMRYKALEYILIPNLIKQRKSIISKLEEIEREEIVRRKKVKEYLESKQISER